MLNMLGELMGDIHDIVSNDFRPVIDDHGSLMYAYEDSAN